MIIGCCCFCSVHWKFLSCLYLLFTFPLPCSIHHRKPDSSPNMPVPSDGTEVAVQTRGCQWLATELDPAYTPKFISDRWGRGSVLGKGWGAVQTAWSPVSHKHNAWTNTILSHIVNNAGTSRQGYNTIFFFFFFFSRKVGNISAKTTENAYKRQDY